MKFIISTDNGRRDRLWNNEGAYSANEYDLIYERGGI